MTEAATLLALSEQMLWHGFAVFLRVGAFVGLMPGFGDTTVPTRIKLALALVFTLPVAAAIPPFLPGAELSRLAVLIATETIAGALLGLSLRMFVFALQTAGAIAAQATSLAQVFAAAGGDPQPAMSHLLVISGLALAMLTGLHVKAASLMILSYEMFPPGAFPAATLVATWGTGMVSRAFALAFTLAAPFVIVSVLYNLTLGAINRAMPQLMVIFVGAPLITFGGLALLMLLSPLMLQVWLAAFEAQLLNPAGMP